MKLEFHPEAELELLEAALRYDLEVPGLLRSGALQSFCWSILTSALKSALDGESSRFIYSPSR